MEHRSVQQLDRWAAQWLFVGMVARHMSVAVGPFDGVRVGVGACWVESLVHSTLVASVAWVQLECIWVQWLSVLLVPFAESVDRRWDELMVGTEVMVRAGIASALVE